MAVTTWALVRAEIEAAGLDSLCIWQPGKSAKILERTGASEVLEALAYAEQQLSGQVLVESWKGSGRKGAGYQWTVGNAFANPSIGAAATGGPGWPEHLKLMLEMQEMRLRNEGVGVAGVIGQVVPMLEKFAPLIVAKLTGTPVPVAPVADVPEGEVDEDLESAFDDVERLKKENPAMYAQGRKLIRDFLSPQS